MLPVEAEAVLPAPITLDRICSQLVALPAGRNDDTATQILQCLSGNSLSSGMQHIAVINVPLSLLSTDGNLLDSKLCLAGLAIMIIVRIAALSFTKSQASFHLSHLLLQAAC